MLPPCDINRLKDLFNICLLCSYVTTGFTNRQLIIIVKDAKGNLNSSDNYRCICIVGLLSKLFDLIMLHMLKGKVDISSAQFSFKAGQSTDLFFNIIYIIAFKAVIKLL